MEYLPIALLLLLLTVGVPIAYSLAVAGIVGISMVSDFQSAASMMAMLPHRIIATYVLISIPLFLFFGFIAERTGIITGTFEAAGRWLGRMPGGLGVATTSAAGVFAAQPKGNYVFIKGNQADPNADFLHEGQLEVLKAAIDAGDIKVVGEQYTENWDPAVAQRNMEQILTAADNKVDAVVASNDGTAGGAVAALTAQGLAGIPVSGQDGDKAALNRIALGTQTVSVWKDSRELGKAAATIALDLAKGAKLADVPGTIKWQSPKGVEMNATFLKPVAITRDNLDVVITAGWISKDEACQGADAAKVVACK